MDRRQFSLPIKVWGSINSKYKPESNYVNPDELTVGSYNFITNTNGALEKRPTDVLYTSQDLSGPGTDQFEAIFTSGTHHLLFMDAGTLKYTSGNTLTTTVQAGYTALASMEYAMYQNRVYFNNGVDAPSVYDLTAAHGGVSYTPPQVKTMGAQVPQSAVTFAADSAAGAVPVGGHTYKVTFLYYGAEESNGGPVSALRTVSAPNQTVNLTAVPTGGYGVTARKIYRDDNDGNWLHVGTITNNTATVFADSVSAGATPTAIPTTNNVPPTFSYIVLNLSRLWIAGVSGTPTTIYWSEAGLPDIFTPTNFVLCNPKDTITGLAVYQGTVYVFNRHSFGQILGNTTDTFYYQEFPGSVGCVDNRSIQVRTVNGVPTLIFLSDRGFYSFNGSSVEYISDKIEDEVNLNLQQVNFVTNSNAQSTDADWQDGTKTPSIDLDTDPGTITLVDPTATYESDTDWDAGEVLENAATKDGLNILHNPALFQPTLASGTLSGTALISGSNVTLPVTTDFTGESVGNGRTYVCSQLLPGVNTQIFVYPIIPTRSGTLTAAAIKFKNDANNGAPFSYRLRIYNDSLGQPGSSKYTGTTFTGNYNGAVVTLAVSGLSQSMVGSTRYWLGVEVFTNPTTTAAKILVKNASMTGGAPRFSTGSGWSTSYGTPSTVSAAADSNTESYSYTSTAVASSGSWVSPVFDSKSQSIKDLTITVGTTSFPTNSTGSLLLQATDDPAFLTGISTYTLVDPTGSDTAFSYDDMRYYRFTWNISTTDNRTVPTVPAPQISAYGTCTWTSAAIDCTTDITAYDTLTMVTTGTGNTILIATSADDITYSSFVALGSAVLQRYNKIKLTTNGPATTHYITSATFTWDLAATFTSKVIDTGQIPSGWGLFQSAYGVNSGTVHFYMRSGSTNDATPGTGVLDATFYEVFNGQFPDANILPLQFVQWKIVFTATAGNLPTIDSVTVNWFLESGQSLIRAASLFYNKTYYLAAAEAGSTTNDVVIAWDWEGSWRIFRGLNISSLGLFFNQPFYLDAVRPNIYQWLIAPDGTGASITMDIRSKAFDFNDAKHLKAPRSLRVTGTNTGATIHAYYSIDRGTTWVEMLNVAGVTGYITTDDGSKFSEVFVPDYTPGNDLWGLTVMFRVISSDAYPCEIISMEPEINIRAGKYLGTVL